MCRIKRFRLDKISVMYCILALLCLLIYYYRQTLTRKYTNYIQLNWTFCPSFTFTGSNLELIFFRLSDFLGFPIFSNFARFSRFSDFPMDQSPILTSPSIFSINHDHKLSNFHCKISFSRENVKIIPSPMLCDIYVWNIEAIAWMKLQS